MVGQDLLNLMEVMDDGLHVALGEDDHVNGLRALNSAQNLFEIVASAHRKFLGGQTTTAQTAASTESTAFPTGFLRIDKLQYLDPSTSRPAWDLDPIQDEGGHIGSRLWPLNITNAIATGAPSGFWTDGTNIYWDPLPDAVHTVRVYGFKSATNITRGGTFAYPDAVGDALSAYAVRIMRSGRDDPPDLEMAREFFEPLIRSLKKFNRTGFARPHYTRVHDC